MRPIHSSTFDLRWDGSSLIMPIIKQDAQSNPSINNIIAGSSTEWASKDFILGKEKILKIIK